ncbi:lycopene cyclase family protein [Belliella pelovolcani]|uniref:lycopene cyclase family protein n=1 Tax=Belliella pelovolcani TaxID=529505 RepID=UPI003919BB77
MTYDFIISGLGCAGFSFLYYLLDSPLKDQNVLVIDASKKDQNDRTWCYWSPTPLDTHPNKDNPTFWNSIALSGKKNTVSSLKNLKYYHIKSSDFYQQMLEMISDKPNIKFVNDRIVGVQTTSEGNFELLTATESVFSGKKIINSIPQLNGELPEDVLKQIFLGWKIRTKNPVFDSKQITLMDFVPNQSDAFSFFYILPYNEREALVEYTLYDKIDIDTTEMISKLRNYIETKFSKDFDITFEEKGSIPMSTKAFSTSTNPNWINVGTIGGCTKPSTGYTYHTIQRHSKQLINELVNGCTKTNLSWNRPFRFKFYDNILLNIASRWPERLPDIFQEMFSRNPGDQVLKFLNEETNFFEELNILRKLSFGIFIKSLLNYEQH